MLKGLIHSHHLPFIRKPVETRNVTVNKGFSLTTRGNVTRAIPVVPDGAFKRGCHMSPLRRFSVLVSRQWLLLLLSCAFYLWQTSRVCPRVAAFVFMYLRFMLVLYPSARENSPVASSTPWRSWRDPRILYLFCLFLQCSSFVTWFCYLKENVVGFNFYSLYILLFYFALFYISCERCFKSGNISYVYFILFISISHSVLTLPSVSLLLIRFTDRMCLIVVVTLLRTNFRQEYQISEGNSGSQ